MTNYKQLPKDTKLKVGMIYYVQDFKGKWHEFTIRKRVLKMRFSKSREETEAEYLEYKDCLKGQLRRGELFVKD